MSNLYVIYNTLNEVEKYLNEEKKVLEETPRKFHEIIHNHELILSSEIPGRLVINKNVLSRYFTKIYDFYLEGEDEKVIEYIDGIITAIDSLKKCPLFEETDEKDEWL